MKEIGAKSANANKIIWIIFAEYSVFFNRIADDIATCSCFCFSLSSSFVIVNAEADSDGAVCDPPPSMSLLLPTERKESELSILGKMRFGFLFSGSSFFQFRSIFCLF